MDNIRQLATIIQGTSYSDEVGTDTRYEILSRLGSLDQEELRSLFIYLSEANSFGQYFGAILNEMTLETLILLATELRILNNDIYQFYRRGIEEAIRQKRKEELWQNLTILKI